MFLKLALFLAGKTAGQDINSYLAEYRVEILDLT